MKVVTNISQFPEFGIDEAALKKAIVKRFHKIKKPIYIHIDKNLVLSHGHHLRDWITDLVKYPTCWTPEFISEIKKHGDLYHRVCLSYSFVYNAFYHRRQNRVETKEWGFKEYFDFDPIDYSYIYLFFLLSHELQHAQQCDYLRLKNYQDKNCHLQYKKHNWKKYANVAHNDNVLEFDAEVASIEKTIKLYESYF
jgi:hypothetical protein